jgi:hypothetical protein
MNLKKNIIIIIAMVAAFALPCFAFSLDDFAVGATYRMTLTTGDVLEGIVDSKTDTSLILDCKGSAYTFTTSVISEYLLLAPPTTKNTAPATAGSASESEAVTYENLKQRQPGTSLEVKLTNDSLFRGKLVAIDDENLKIDIGGSVIPIAQNAVDNIIVLTVKKPQEKPATAAPQVFDTLIVKNPEIDDYGRAGENLVVVGKIVKEDNVRVIVQSSDDKQESYTFDQVIRIFRHSNGNPEEDQIKRYAMPIFCPQGMVLVDLPPGKANRPFFKVCIDKYEYPNNQGTVPKVAVSYDDAQKLCEQAGKRLCTTEEWRWACSGLEGYTYPYGVNLEKENCNREGDRNVEPSGARNKCISKFGAMDMTGNVFEWVKDNKGASAAMGGPMSKCQTVSPGTDGDAKPTIGLRCCKSN